MSYTPDKKADGFELHSVKIQIISKAMAAVPYYKEQGLKENDWVVFVNGGFVRDLEMKVKRFPFFQEAFLFVSHEFITYIKP